MSSSGKREEITGSVSEKTEEDPLKRRRTGSLVSGRSARVVLVTVPSAQEAKRLAQGILGEKLAACVNLVPRIRSWYWWKGRVTSDPEVLMVIKTARSSLKTLHAWIRANHPYEVPEFLALSVTHGDSTYLKWLQSSLC